MQTPKQWTHQRRANGAADPVDALIEVSVSAAASGDVLNAIRLVRFAEEMAKFRRKREVARTFSITRPPLPQKTLPTVMPPAPAPTCPPELYRPPPGVTDPLALTPEEEARFAAIRAARQSHERNG